MNHDIAVAEWIVLIKPNINWHGLVKLLRILSYSIIIIFLRISFVSIGLSTK